MVDQVRQFDYQYLISEGNTPAAAEIVNALTDSGIALLGYSEFPCGSGRAQVDLITEGGSDLDRAARRLGWTLSPKKSGFLIQGEDRPNAIGEILDRLASVHVHVTAVHAVAAGAGRFGAMLWVKPWDTQSAAVALSNSAYDEVEESSEESFPASDSPAWALGNPR